MTQTKPNQDYVDVVKLTSQTAGLHFAVPGTIEAEKFVNKSTDIKIENDGSNQTIGFIQNNSFTEYKVNVTTTGSYNFTVTAAANTTNGGVLAISINNQSFG